MSEPKSTPESETLVTTGQLAREEEPAWNTAVRVMKDLRGTGWDAVVVTRPPSVRVSVPTAMYEDYYVERRVSSTENVSDVAYEIDQMVRYMMDFRLEPKPW